MKPRFLFLLMLLSSFLGGLLTLIGYWLFFDSSKTNAQNHAQNVQFSKVFDKKNGEMYIPNGLNFVYAAQKATPAVVHIKTYFNGAGELSYEPEASVDDLFEWFKRYEGNDRKSVSSGSGVIISQDGYIVTNHHVIEDAEKIEVVLEDKRKYEATVVGIDPTTDLALIKIEEMDLEFVQYGNSDEVQIGEWVLAVGNPFDLTSTVTAGIVSARARDINILNDTDRLSIESFIQTDAAVNPGNSGGALVNLKGELIGINTAIATSTGGYAGYSFAVPSALAAKIAEDLLLYGEVQRALLGVSIQDVNAELVEEKRLKVQRGIFVADINEKSAADISGIRIGDVIIGVNEKEVFSVSALQEQVARFRPGDKIKLKIDRNGKVFELSTTLRNKNNTTELSKKLKEKSEFIEEIGTKVAYINNEEKRKLGLKNGIKIIEILGGKAKAVKIPVGFIITHIDKEKIDTISELKIALKDKKGGVLIEGINPNGEKAFYGIGF